MAWTKFKLAEQARRVIIADNPSAKDRLQPQELIVYVAQAFANAVQAYLFAEFKKGEYDINGSLMYSFEEIDIHFDEARQEYYSTMPATYVNLPCDMGVNFVGPMQDRRSKYILVNPNWTSLSRGLRSQSLQGQIGFYTENNKIFYVNMRPENKNCKVFIRLVAAIDTIEDDEELGIPADVQNMIVRETVELYRNAQK